MVIALEMSLGAAVAGPFDIAQAELSRIITRVLAAAHSSMSLSSRSTNWLAYNRDQSCRGPADQRRSGSPSGGCLEPAVERDQIHAQGGRVEVTLVPHQADLELSVADNGRGISPRSCHTSSIGSRGPTVLLRVRVEVSASAWPSSGI